MEHKPNVILILADDLGIGDLSCFNPESKIHTENLDRLAAEGIRCTDMHATSALCTPSRYGLMTGRYNWRSILKKGVVSGYAGHIIEDGRATLGTLFKKSGYQTACVGKWHLGLDWDVRKDSPKQATVSGYDYAPEVDFTKPVKNGPNDYGFDYSYVTPGSLDIAPYVFLENGMVTKPPCGRTGTKENYPRGVVSDPKDRRIYVWPEGQTSADFVHQNVVPDSAERILSLIDRYSRSDKPFFLYYPIHAPHLPCLPTPEFAGKSTVGPYGDMVLMIDDIVGRIMAKLSEKGIQDNTLIVFTSDNGSENSYPELGHEPSSIYRGHKSDIWDGGHRVPFIVKLPKALNAAGIVSQICCLSDLYATFAELLEIPVGDSEAEDSISNLPLWKGIDEPVHPYVVHSSGKGKFAIRKGRWKLEMCSWSGGFDDGDVDTTGMPPIQLYDLAADIGETVNLCDVYPEIVHELREELTACILNGRSTVGTPQSNTGDAWWPELEWIGKDHVPASE